MHFNVVKQIFLHFCMDNSLLSVISVHDCAYNRAYLSILVTVKLSLIWAAIEFVYNLYWADNDLKVY